MLDSINQPWNLLPTYIKQWVRDHGYVIRESTSGATYYSAWRDEYLKTTEH